MIQINDVNLKKVIKNTTAIILTILLIGLITFSSKNNSNITPVQASSISIPKNMRGNWKSKPIYMSDSKHIKKNIAVPAMKMKVTAKKVRWHFVGYLPATYKHTKHTIKLVSKENGQVTLKGHGPYRDINYLYKTGKWLNLGYHGGFINFTRVSK